MSVKESDIAPLKDATLWGFLEKAKTLRLATVLGRKPITVSPVWFVTRQNFIYFFIDPTIGDPGRATTQGAKHLSALDGGGKVSGVIDEGEDLSSFRGVSLEGAATPVKNGKIKEELTDLTLVKYFYEGHPHLEHFLSQGALEERRWYKVIVQTLDGWDRRMLPQAPIMERRVFPHQTRKK